jgi:hypothetical protein
MVEKNNDINELIKGRVLSDSFTKFQKSIKVATRPLIESQKTMREIGEAAQNALTDHQRALMGPTASLAKSFADMYERTKELSDILLSQGIIRNREAVTNLLSQRALLSTPLMSRIKLNDAMIEFRKNLDSLKEIKLPFDSLYENILNSMDQVTVEKIQSIALAAEEAYEQDDKDDEDVQLQIKNHFAYDTALKLNVYVTVTQNHIEQHGTEEEKKAWEKIVNGVLKFLIQFFIAWAFSNTPVQDMNIVHTAEQIIHVVENFEQDQHQVKEQNQQQDQHQEQQHPEIKTPKLEEL